MQTFPDYESKTNEALVTTIYKSPIGVSELLMVFDSLINYACQIVRVMGVLVWGKSW